MTNTMKYFTLTPDSKNLFIQRFNSLLNRKGALKCYAVYSGAAWRRKILENIPTKLQGIELHRRFDLPVVSTIDQGILREKITYPWQLSRDGSGITMVSGGSFIYIAFGTRVYASSEKIVWKEAGSVSLPPSTNFIVADDYHNSLCRIEEDESMEQSYYMDMEDELLDD